MSSRGVLFVVSAPSGTGKTTLCQALLKLMPQMRYSVSATTRLPRAGEIDGTHYFFLSEKDFQSRAARGEFLEHANVFGQWYGTPRDFVEGRLAAGEDVLLDVDVQGGASIRKKKIEGVFIFLVPPSRGALEERLNKRKTDSTEGIRRRLAQAQEELKYIPNYDYVVVNELVEDSLQRIKSIILAEKCRIERNKEVVEKWLSMNSPKK